MTEITENYFGINQEMLIGEFKIYEISLITQNKEEPMPVLCINGESGRHSVLYLEL